jgi:superfamily II DNA helicase RecQ
MMFFLDLIPFKRMWSISHTSDISYSELSLVICIQYRMYHKSTHQDSKERILTEFKSGSSRIRYIIATIALGVGLDIQDVQLVVHIGCPKSIL